MRKRRLQKGTVSILLCLSMLVGLVMGSGGISALATSLDTELTEPAEGNEQPENGETTTTTKLNIGTSDLSEVTWKEDPDEELGTEANPLMVLEIVPSLDQAQIGFYFNGCEPVDMDKVAAYYDSKTNATKDYIQFGDLYDIQETTEYKCYEDIPADTKSSVYPANSFYSSRTDLNDKYVTYRGNHNVWYQDSSDPKCSVEGYFYRVAEGTGNFELYASWSYAYNPTGVDAPNWQGKYYFVYQENGNYAWSETAPEDSTVECYQVTRNDLFKCTTLKFVNKNTYLQAIYGEDVDEDFKVEVITVTPEMLKDSKPTGAATEDAPEAKEHSYLDLIDQADLIIVRTGLFKQNITSALWNFASTYSGPYATPSGKLEASTQVTFVGNDLSNEAVLRIMDRMGSDDAPALVMEANQLQAGGGTSNTFKLTLMAMQYEGSYFKEHFLQKVKDDTLAAKSDTLVYNGTAEWSQSTFAGPYHNPDPNSRYYNASSSGFNVMKNVMSYNGSGFDVYHMLSGESVNGSINDDNYVKEWMEYEGEEDPNNPKNSYSVLDIMHYLMNPDNTVSLHVLEIEPGDTFIYDNTNDETHARWKEYYQQLFSWNNSQSAKPDAWMDKTKYFNVDTMTAEEFIGSVGTYTYDGSKLTKDSSDDLISKYDVIVIGAEEDDSVTRNENSVLYAGVGALVGDNAGSRYSGNDITLKKMYELTDYLAAGKIVVVDDGLYINGTTVNTAKVDSSSNLYAFLTSQNVMVYGNASLTDIQKSVKSTARCILEFNKDKVYPAEYSYTADADGAIDPKTETTVETDENGKATLKFRFKITGNKTYTYCVRLYLDLNSDGVFGGSLKETSEVDHMNLALGTSDAYDQTEEELEPTTLNKYGKNVAVSCDELKASTWYVATFELTDSMQGILPWKLEVYNKDNTALRSSAIDYTVVQTDAPQKLNVLQMNLTQDLTDTTDTDNSYAGGTKFSSSFLSFAKKYVKIGTGYNSETDYTDESSAKLQNKLTSAQQDVLDTFTTYLDAVSEYDVNIQFLFNNDWATLFSTGTGYGVDTESTVDDLTHWEEFLSRYDILILGFEDAGKLTNNSVFVLGVQDFISQGKGVILSHDLSKDAEAEASTVSKYDSWVRSISGQRRAYYNWDAGVNTYAQSYAQTYLSGNLIDFTSSLQTSLLHQNLGLTLDGNAIDAIANGAAGEYRDNSTKLLLGLMSDTTGETTQIEIANNGQVTTYPYKIDSTIEVASTHVQNYQLDMEYQESGDATVWYNLKGVAPNTDGDSRNNYYLYTKGNITYTGLGNSVDLTKDEIKLFVNTLICAYRKTEQAPAITYVNVNTTANDGTSIKYLDYDSGVDQLVDPSYNKGDDGTEYVDVIMKVSDVPLSTTNNKTYWLKPYYYDEDAGEMKVASDIQIYEYQKTAGGYTYGNRLLLSSCVTKDASDQYYNVNASRSGVRYIMRVPKAYWDDSMISVYAFAEYQKDGKTISTAKVSKRLKLMYLPLFNLN